MTSSYQFLVGLTSICMAITIAFGQVDNTSQKLARPDGHKTFMADDRVRIVEPRGVLLLAESNQIYLEIVGQASLSTINVEQRVVSPGSPFFLPVYDGISDAPVLTGGSSERYINVVPLRLGTVMFHLSGRFADGGIFFKDITAQVEPSARTPSNLILGSGTQPDRSTPFIILSLSHPLGGVVVPNAVYLGIRGPIPLDYHFVKFKVRTEDKVAPISLDEATGRMIPVHAGSALVESSFGGITLPQCVVVQVKKEREDYRDFHNACDSLLNPGQHLPTWQ